MSKAEDKLPAWQQVSIPVSDMELYPYLLKLAVVAIKKNEAANAQKQEEASSAPSLNRPVNTNAAKLPRGTMKALMSYFKSLALDKQPEPVEPMLKRTYLAFYAQLLEIKSSQPQGLDDLGQTGELLLAKFLGTVSKVSGSKSVASQGIQFVTLLRAQVRKLGGSPAVDSQLAALGADLDEKKVPKKPTRKAVKSMDTEGVANTVSRIMLVSPTLFERDLEKQMAISLEGCALFVQQLKFALESNQHPLYQSSDFGSETAWASFASEEMAQLADLEHRFPSPLSSVQAAPDLIPHNVRAFFAAFIQRCIEADAKSPILFDDSTRRLITFVRQFWRISSHAFVSCMLSAVRRLYAAGQLELSDVASACEYVVHSFKDDHMPWPFPDAVLAKDAVQGLQQIVLQSIEAILLRLFEPKIPKLGPYIQFIQENLSSLASLWGGSLEVTQTQRESIIEVIEGAAEREYVRLVNLLPRDTSLDLNNILEFVQAVVGIARKLQSKYKLPLLGQIAIARIVCSQQLKLLFSDFPPIYDYCMKQYDFREEVPPFNLMTALHDELVILHDLQAQIVPGNEADFDPEALLFPYFIDWAKESANLSRQWVKPVIEQDTNMPIDQASNKMYSAAVKDLFNSFYSSISLVEKQHWIDEYYVARLLTITIGGISAALCDWAAQLFGLFMQELRPEKSKLRIKAKEQDEQWLAYAKEATAQATAAVLATRQSQQQDAFIFKRECGVKINNVAVAYEMLHQMESKLNSDDISKRVQNIEKSRQGKSRSSSYLFTLTVIGANGLSQKGGGYYVTLVDQDSRKQVGKTSIAYGVNKNPSWNEPLELEVNATRPKLLKATLWCDNQQVNHELCGKTMIRLDPSQFSRREYGTQLKWIDLEPGPGKLQVMLAIDLLQDDIRFHFGKALRYLKRTQDTMINTIVKQFSGHIFAIISRQTLREVAGPGSLASSVQTGVTQLQKSFNSWLGKPAASMPEQSPAQEKAIDDCLVPLYDYLNENFATLAGTLTPELRIEVLSGTWDIVLEALELLIIPPLDFRRTSQTQLSNAEMEAVYSWLKSLRDFFHSGGAGPSLERLQSQSYQQIMAIPVYYDLPTRQLRVECEKVVKTSLRALAGNQELIARQRTVMAHRNKSIIEHQAIQLQNAQRTTPQLDDVILRILRLRDDSSFIEQHMKFRERLLQRELTERALQGSVF